MDSGRTLFTIGHSNHPLSRFLEILQTYRIQVVVDVRSAPYSRHVPEYNKQQIEIVLKDNGCRYLFMGDSIGGKPEEPAYRDADGRVDYGKIAASASFKRGIGRLLKGLQQEMRIVLMCAEEDPRNCHRHLLIARELEVGGKAEVMHIRADGRVLPASELQWHNPVQISLF